MRFGFGYWLGFMWVLYAPALLLAVWGTMDALVRPDSQWADADQNKTAWVVGMLFGPIALFPVGVMVPLVYLFGVRSRLTGAARGYGASLPRTPPD